MDFDAARLVFEAEATLVQQPDDPFRNGIAIGSAS